MNENERYGTYGQYGAYGPAPQNPQEDDDSGFNIDIKFILVQILKRWWLFVISLAICMSIAYLKNRSWQPRYTSSALVIIEENKGMMGSSQLLQGFTAEKAYRNVNNQVIMFGSYELVKRVVAKNPDLLIDYYTQGRFKTNNLYKVSPVDIKASFIAPDSYYRPFSITDLGDNRYRVSAEKTKSRPEISFEGVYGEPVENSLFFITVNKTDFYTQGFSIFFKFQSEDAVVSRYSSTLSFDFLMKGASVVKVSVGGGVPQRDCDFINSLCDEFLADNLARKNDAAIKTIEFIDAQLESISDSLRASENRLKNYKSNNYVISSGGDNLVSKYSQLDALENEIRLKESYLAYLSNYLTQNVDEGVIIAPSNLGISDASLSGNVSKYTEIQLKKHEVGEKSPLIAKYDRELDALKEQIFESLKNLQVGIDIQRKDLARRQEELDGKMREMPYKQQQLANIEREFKMNDNYYTFLMQKRADAQIQKASNSSDNIILDRARMSSIVMTNGKEKSKTTSTFLMLGLFLPLALIVGVELLIPYVRTDKELEKIAGRYKIIGMVAHTKHRTPVVIDKYPKSAMAESFRSIRTKLEFLTGKSDNICILMTSSESGDGKTYLSANLAGTYALTGKRTILVDLDLRKPSVATLLNIRANAGLSNCLIGSISLDEAIITDSDYKFDILPVGTIPPNPGELVRSERMREIIAELKQRYDYVIIDTSPVGLVADSLAIVRHTDYQLFSVRCGKTNKTFLRNTIAQLESNNIEACGIVFNDIEFKKAEYSSYSGKYGSYGNYGGAYYGYTVGKHKNKAKDYFGGYYDSEE